MYLFKILHYWIIWDKIKLRKIKRLKNKMHNSAKYYNLLSLYKIFNQNVRDK